MQKLKVALVGLGFGGAFAPIYKEHPDVGEIVVFDINKELEKKVCDMLGIESRYNTFEEILADESIDAVHLVTPIPLHEEQSAAVLESGKHCACTVPMATSLAGIEKILKAQKKSKKQYMMMETTLFTYQFFYVKQMLESGELGKIQFLRGSHYQDMTGWPQYWMGLPPMYYGTHAVSPMRVLAGAPFKNVVCFGSGTMDKKLVDNYNNPYPIESCLFEFENGLKGEATRALFETARAYQEGMFVYGSKRCFEWGFCDNNDPYITTLKEETWYGRSRLTDVKQTTMPNYIKDLPEELWHFTVGKGYDPLNPQESLKKGAGAGHHGSHPHLVNEFIKCIINNSEPAVDKDLAANITAACICAHESAMNGGVKIEVPHITV